VPRTEGDLLPGLGRQYEGEDEEHREQAARNDEVERVVESSTSNVDRVRDVEVRLRAALVLVDVPRHRYFCVHQHTRTLACSVP